MAFLNYKEEIREKTLDCFSDLLSDIINIYYANKKIISKKEILQELLTIRDLKQTEVDRILNNAIKLSKNKCQIDEFNERE